MPRDLPRSETGGNAAVRMRAGFRPPPRGFIALDG